jgi:hypothetical protein
MALIEFQAFIHLIRKELLFAVKMEGDVDVPTVDAVSSLAQEARPNFGTLVVVEKGGPMEKEFDNNLEHSL